MVNFENDVKKHLGVFCGEYEKANIWPEFRDNNEFVNVLDEEIKESCFKLDELHAAFACLKDGIEDEVFTVKKTKYVRGHAIGAICELLQVVAVCNKYLS